MFLLTSLHIMLRVAFLDFIKFDRRGSVEVERSPRIREIRVPDRPKS